MAAKFYMVSISGNLTLSSLFDISSHGISSVSFQGMFSVVFSYDLTFYYCSSFLDCHNYYFFTLLQIIFCWDKVLIVNIFKHVLFLKLCFPFLDIQNMFSENYLSLKYVVDIYVKISS